MEAWADLESVVRAGVVKARGGTEEQIEVIWALLVGSFFLHGLCARCGRAPQLRRLEKEWRDS